MRMRSLRLRKLKNFLLTGCSLLSVGIAVGAVCWVLYTVVDYGHQAFGWSLLTHPSAPYGSLVCGIGNALLGTLMIALGAAVMAVPLGMLAGIFLSEFREYARLSSAIRFAVNGAMGVPSVLIGLFVYVVMVVPSGSFSGFAGSVALGILMFPVIVKNTEDMLSMVPNTLRESALALGMTRTRATLAIVCKSARNGLLTGILLSLARVSGETAPLIFTAMYSDNWPTRYFSQPTPSLPVLMTEYATNSPFATMQQVGWSAALVVMTLVLVVNIMARIVFRERTYGR